MEQIKKSLRIKTSSLRRLVKEYQSYTAELSKFHLNEGAFDPETYKKQQQFHTESAQALEAVRKSLNEFRQGLRDFLVEKQADISMNLGDLQDEVKGAEDALQKSIEIVPEETVPSPAG